MNKLLLSLFAMFLTITSSYSQKTNTISYETDKKEYISLENAKQLNEQLKEVKLGFEFNFNDKNRELIYINKNGFLTFDKMEANLTDILKTGKINTFIAPLTPFKSKVLDNLIVRYKTTEINNKKCFIAEWSNNIISFQAYLYDTGEIEFKYSDIEKSKIDNTISGIIEGNKAIGYFPLKIDKELTKLSIEKISTHTFINNYKTKESLNNNKNSKIAESYTFSAFSGSYSALGGTALNSIEVDQAVSAAIPIGFTFNYCGTDYTQVIVSSNGWISFDLTETNSQSANDLDGDTYTPKPLLAPLWDDLDGSASGRATYETSGTSPNRIFTMDWNRWEWNYAANGRVIHFQVKLYESDGAIEFIYDRGNTAPNSPSASIGIQDAGGNFLSLDGTGASPNASSVTETSNLSTRPANDQVYRWDRPLACVTPTNQPTALNLTPVGANQIDGSFTAATSSPDGYLVVRSTNSTLSSDPVDATTYVVNDVLGGGVVVQASSATSFSSTCLSQNTQFYYFIFSYNDACSGGPAYLCTSSIPSVSPLTGNATTGSASADETLPYTQNFDTNDGWTYGAGGTWARGNQTNDAFGPPSGHSGNSVAGTNLNAEYGNNVDDYLVSPTFDLAGTNGPTISFWMDMESESGLDGGTVQIQVNGCNWTTIDMSDPGYGGLVPTDTDVDGMQDGEDGWEGTEPTGEWDEVTIDLFSLNTSGLSNITNNDIIQVRYWFGSDGSVTYPGWYIDDFNLYDPAPCSEPTAQPTNLVLTAGYTSVSGTFDAAVPAADEYIVIVSTDATLAAGDLPIDGNSYAPGAVIGDGTVVQSSSNTNFNATGLTMGTQYYFFVFSYNTTACAGRNYLTTNSLTGNTTTYDCSNGTVPYSENFDAVTTPNLPQCWTIEDNDAPDDDWETSTTDDNSPPNCMRISYDFSNPLDDWAFSPGLNLVGGTTYTLEFYYKAGGSSYNESLRVRYGTGQSSAAMTTTIFTDASFNHTTYQLASVNFTPGSSGVYYFGWHAYSITNQLAIAVDDIFIYEPGPPSITSISPGYLYKDKGTQMTINGNNLGSPTSVTLGGIIGTVVSSTYSEATIDFPAGNYSNNTLTYTTAVGTDNYTYDVRTRNIIPVDASASLNDDEHQTITSAVDGLFAWYGTTAFSAGDLPGTKTIQVFSGTYNEMVVPNSSLNTSSGNRLIFEVKPGQQATVNASGLNYGFDVNTDYITIKGFSVENAINDNIRSQGNNCEISYNKCYKAQIAGIRAYQTTTLSHNLVYNNTSYGIYLENAANAVVKHNTTYKNGGIAGSAGYVRTVDLGSGSIYNWERHPGWTQIPSVDDDTYTVDFGGGNNFPFDFSFWGSDFYATTDVLGISSNGLLNIGSSYNVTYTNYSLADDYTNDNTLCCNWDDMDADDYTSDGMIQYSVEGTAPNRRLIVVWYNRAHYQHRGDANADNTDVVAVEAKIFETTNIIEFHYNDLVYDPTIADDRDWGSSSTIGIKKDDATYDEYHFSNETIDTDVDHNLQGGAIRYTPNPTTGTELYIASGSNILVENNIMESLDDGGTSPFYVMEAPSGAITAGNFNYNNFYKGTNTNIINIGGTDYVNIPGTAGTGNIETDPKFVDASGYDYHIKSSAAGASFHTGEWPPFTAGTGTWTADNDISPCVDTGDPTGTYDLEQPDNGSRLNIGCYGNTLQATKTNVLVGIWTGAVDSVWNIPNNWSDASVPTGSCISGPGSDATVPDVSAESGNFPYIDNAAEVDNLTIDANANIQIAPGGSLTVCSTLTNNGGNAGLVILSDLTGDGSLMHSTSNVPATVYRFLEGTQYHYIGSPISNATTVGIGIQGGGSGIQFYDWDATMHWNGMGASPPTTIDYAPWGTTYAGALNVGTGYAYYYAQSILTFSGNLNTGNYNYTLYDESGNSSDDDQGWNFVANPYPSSLDWDIVTGTGWDNDVESAIYLFDDDGSGVQANYRYYVPAAPGSGGTYGVGTANATKDIPIGQAFFIKANKDNQPLAVLNTDRIHSSQSFYKANNNLLRLNVNGNDGNDEMIIRFIPEATENFDGKYDARKLITSNPFVPQIYSVTADGSNSAINSMPELNQSYDIPLTFICLEGEYTVNLSEFNFTNKRVFLEDLYTKKAEQLSANTVYEFNHEGGLTADRFILHFVINTAPYIKKPIQDQEAPNNTGFNFTINDDTFIDDDFGDIINYTATLTNNSPLPEWLIFNNKKKTFYSSKPVIGNYEIKVTATDMAGETAEDEFILNIYDITLGTNNINNDIVVYPNPNNGIFHIVANHNISAKKIEITDIAGKIIYLRKDITSIPKEINLSEQEAGSYFLKIYLKNSILHRKIIIK